MQSTFPDFEKEKISMKKWSVSLILILLIVLPGSYLVYRKVSAHFHPANVVLRENQPLIAKINAAQDPAEKSQLVDELLENFTKAEQYWLAINTLMEIQKNISAQTQQNGTTSFPEARQRANAALMMAIQRGKKKDADGLVRYMEEFRKIAEHPDALQYDFTRKEDILFFSYGARLVCVTQSTAYRDAYFQRAVDAALKMEDPTARDGVMEAISVLVGSCGANPEMHFTLAEKMETKERRWKTFLRYAAGNSAVREPLTLEKFLASADETQEDQAPVKRNEDALRIALGRILDSIASDSDQARKNWMLAAMVKSFQSEPYKKLCIEALEINTTLDADMRTKLLQFLTSPTPQAAEKEMGLEPEQTNPAEELDLMPGVGGVPEGFDAF